MIMAKQDLRLILVTPETTVLDEPVQALRFQLYDGQAGILPGRAPVVGRLGYGELRITGNSGIRSFYIDGGFVQVKGSVVSLLTNRAVPSGEIDTVEAEKLLEKTRLQIATGDLEFIAKDRDQERARQMLALARRSS
jgi:F-type H+-transporting ATPase subunit epsilon